MKKIITFLLLPLLVACTSSLSSLDIEKAKHFCESKGTVIDEVVTGVPLKTYVVCSDGSSVVMKEYNPHAK